MIHAKRQCRKVTTRENGTHGLRSARNGFLQRERRKERDSTERGREGGHDSEQRTGHIYHAYLRISRIYHAHIKLTEICTAHGKGVRRCVSCVSDNIREISDIYHVVSRYSRWVRERWRMDASEWGSVGGGPWRVHLWFVVSCHISSVYHEISCLSIRQCITYVSRDIRDNVSKRIRTYQVSTYIA